MQNNKQERSFDTEVSALQETFSDCADFQLQQISFGEARLAVAYFKGMCSRESLGELVMKPLLTALQDGDFTGNFGALLRCASLKTPKTQAQTADALLRGEVFLAVGRENGTAWFCLANLQSGLSRSVGEPDSDVTVRGPRLGFVEDAEKNMTLLRQFLRTGDLKFVSLTVGSVSHTRVTLAYLESRADKKLVDNLSRKIAGLRAEALMDSGNLEMLLQGRHSPLFPMMGSTEKADKAASKLLAGRVGILVDGSPFVLTAPYVFAESLQSAEDYLRTPYYATAVRFLRFFSLLLSLFLPALLVACFDFHPELLPDALRSQIEESRADLPLSMFWECVACLAVFELVREVGVRMPRTVGDAVGIVASIILGDAAVQAGLASALVIMAVALSAVCAFIVPVYMYATVLLRFLFLFIAELFGFPGLALGAAMLLILSARMDSFGAPYLSPLSPLHPKGLEDFLIAIPKKTLGRKEEL